MDRALRAIYEPKVMGPFKVHPPLVHISFDLLLRNSHGENREAKMVKEVEKLKRRKKLKRPEGVFRKKKKKKSAERRLSSPFTFSHARSKKKKRQLSLFKTNDSKNFVSP